MLRVFLGLVGCAVLTSTTFAANIWLSTVGCPTEGPTVGCDSVASPPPTSVPTITRPPGAQGTLYIWARPTAGKTLENWSLHLESTNPNLITFSSSSVSAFNPVLGQDNGKDIVRWEFAGEPSNEASLSMNGMNGLNIFGVDRQGIGLGPGSAAVDPFYNSDENAWLLASIDYSVAAEPGQAAIYLQIGVIGMNHLEDVDDESGSRSSKTNVIFGRIDDNPLNAEHDRVQTDGLGNPIPGTGWSETPDLLINVANTAPGDFDGDGDVDGRDFLHWQRNPSVGPLADWQANYGSRSLDAVSSIPEPCTGLLVIACGFALWNTRGRYRRFPCFILH